MTRNFFNMLNRTRFGALIVLGLTLGLVWRITTNVDLADESYYAIFIFDWLHGGIGTSKLATVHQTAALVVFPFARVYASALRSEFGLLLFLRSIFLMGSALSAIVWYLYLERSRGTETAWLGAATCLSFIPFGLPAPSYNTLGLQGLLIALASLGLVCLAHSEGRKAPAAQFASAAAWAVAVIAYPTMAVPLLFLLVLILFLGRELVPRPILYASAVVAIVSLSCVLVFIVVPFSRIQDSIAYHGSVSAPGNILAKVDLIRLQLTRDPTFAGLLAVTATAGVLRPFLPVTAVAAVIAGVLTATYIYPPALFLRSHDAISLVAIGGLGLVVGIRARVAAGEKTIAILFATSLAAGLATMLTSFNGAYNFCIGAAPAAILALSAPRSVTPSQSFAKLIPQLVLILVTATSSLTFLYGDDPADLGKRERITWGAFAGLNVQSNQAKLIGMMPRVSGFAEPDRTMTIFGLATGLILATDAQPLSPMMFPLVSSTSPSVAPTKSFYDLPSNRPKVVLVHLSPYLHPINPMGSQFPNWYNHVQTLTAGQNVLEVYQRR